MKELKNMRRKIIELAELEATRLYRMARKALAHGCKMDTVNAIREEANWLHTTATAYPDRLLDWDFEGKIKFAFKY